jgi:hypothetical protein
MSWLNKSNIHTALIEEALGVTRDVALRVQDQINNYYSLDWSEATRAQIKRVSLWAFEDLNQNHKF